MDRRSKAEQYVSNRNWKSLNGMTALFVIVTCVIALFRKHPQCLQLGREADDTGQTNHRRLRKENEVNSHLALGDGKKGKPKTEQCEGKRWHARLKMHDGGHRACMGKCAAGHGSPGHRAAPHQSAMVGWVSVALPATRQAGGTP
jgi:hypothetical protein